MNWEQLQQLLQIRAGKTAIQDQEFRQQKLNEAEASHKTSMENYATLLTQYETELPEYQKKVADWQTATKTTEAQNTALQTKYEADKQAAQNSPQIQSWDWQNTINAEYRNANYQRQNELRNIYGSDVTKSALELYGPRPTPQTIQPPTLYPFPEQPKMNAQNPGTPPSFTFVMPDSPYAAAVTKLTQMPRAGAMGSYASQSDPYQAVRNQQSPWWM